MAKKEFNAWTAVQMYCPNCGTMSVGYKDEEGKCHFQCERCSVVMVRSYKNRRHDLIEITVPQGRERLSVS